MKGGIVAPSVTTTVGKASSGDDLAMGSLGRSALERKKGTGKAEGIYVSTQLEQRDNMV